MFKQVLELYWVMSASQALSAGQGPSVSTAPVLLPNVVLQAVLQSSRGLLHGRVAAQAVESFLFFLGRQVFPAMAQIFSFFFRKIIKPLVFVAHRLF